MQPQPPNAQQRAGLCEQYPQLKTHAAGASGRAPQLSIVLLAPPAPVGKAGARVRAVGVRSGDGGEGRDKVASKKLGYAGWKL
jgi:hypothetical protein